MLTSIRWRLVMGTMLLTLITVSAVGVVALLIMQRYMAQQEHAYLTANAEAIAQQAVTFMSPVQVAPPLQQLAQTAAFLGDVTVRIVDGAKMPLADSTLANPYAKAVGVAASPVYFRVAPYPPSQYEIMPAQAMPDEVMQTNVMAIAQPQMLWETTTNEYTLEAMPPPSTAATMPSQNAAQEAKVIVVQKSPSFWGDRLTFEARAEAIPISSTLPFEYSAVPVMPDDIMQQNIDMFAVAGSAVEAAEVDAAIAEPVAGVGGAPAGIDYRWEKQRLDEIAVAQPTFLQLAGFQSTAVVTAPIETGGTVVGFVELGRADALVNEPLGAIRDALAIAAGASALLAIAVGLVMSRTLTAPIQNLAQAAAAMSSGDLTARAPVVGRDELASLALQFNQMADALHHSFVELAAERDTLRRFVADASHELRTPITALRTFNELLQGPAQADFNARQEFLAESHAQIARLEWITRNLLDLSRWDGGMATLVKSDVDVGELVMAVVAPFRALAQERKIELNIVLPKTPVVATVDGPRLGMAVANLLDNALKFTPDGGKVEVGVCREAQGVKIWVMDTGIGIAAEELRHIFARFYRSPRATQMGSGLGLAIVERIVCAHDATIEVESEEGVGSRFTLCLLERD